jgi:hypothetical protein
LRHTEYLSKKIMPQQVQASAFDQILAGEAHDLTNLFTMSWPIAMDIAVFAAWTVFERTSNPSLACIDQKVPAFRAKRVSVQRQP